MSEGREILSLVHNDDLPDICMRVLAVALKGVGCSPELYAPIAYLLASVKISFDGYVEVLVKIIRKKGVMITEVIKQVGLNGGACEQWMSNRECKDAA
jgi:hypothetical protein